MANVWVISQDEAVFDLTMGDLQDFMPERWLQQGEGDSREEANLWTDLPLPVFGQGRRICQGKRVATDGTFMQVASLLWAFDFELIDSEVLDPWEMVVVGFMTMPRERKFRLKPRGDWVLEAIQREWEVADKSLDKVMGTAKDVEK